jgi:hypothetical protein
MSGALPNLSHQNTPQQLSRQNQRFPLLIQSNNNESIRSNITMLTAAYRLINAHHLNRLHLIQMIRTNNANAMICYGPSSWTRIWFCTDTPHNQIQISTLTSLNKEQHSYMETTERMQTVRLYLTGAFNCCDQEYWHSNGMAWDASSLLSTLQVEKRYFSFFIV